MASIFTKNTVRVVGVLSVILFFTAVSAVSPFVAFTVSAQTPPGQYTLLQPLPCINNNGANEEEQNIDCPPGTLRKTVDFETYVQYVFNLIIAIAAVAAVFMIVWGGFKYTSTDSILGKNEGKDIIWKAVQGLLLVLCSYLLLRTIDPRLVEIPATLVEPLKIRCASNTNLYVTDTGCTSTFESITSGFYDQLKSESSVFKTNMQDYARKIQESESRVNGLLAEKAAFEEKQQGAIRAHDEQGALLYEAKVADIQNQINTEKGEIKLLVAKGAFDSITYSYSPSTGTAGRDFGAAATKIDAAYERQKNELRANNADSGQINELSDYAEYSKAVVAINEQIAKVNDVNRKYFNDQTFISRAIGSVDDIADAGTFGASSLITPIDWLTYSPKEYQTDLIKAQDSARAEMQRIVSSYRSEISDQQLYQKLVQQSLDKTKLIMSMK